MVDPDAMDEAFVNSESDPSAHPLDLLGLLLILWSRRLFLLCATVAALLLGLTIAYLIKPSFTSTAIVLPPQQQPSSAAALMSQLGSLTSLAGPSSLGLKSPSEMYVGLLKSRTVADAIIRRFDLAQVYKSSKMVELRKALASHTDIEAGKDGLIHINVTDHDPNRSSEVANAYVDGLYQLNSSLATTEAAQRRVFFDRQVEEEKKALANAEDDLRATEHKTGVIQLGGQTQELLVNMANLRAQLSSAEVQLQGMRTYATDQNPDVMLVQQRIATLRGQIAKLESDQKQQFVAGDINLSAGRTPEDSLEYTRKLREVKYHDTLYDLLSKQREAARIDEAKSAPVLQLIDGAVPSDKKSGPPRILLTLAVGFTGLLFAILWTLLSSSLATFQWPQLTRRRLNRAVPISRTGAPEVEARSGVLQ
jgi:tyrosine-protein kinase Etk/Wzc